MQACNSGGCGAWSGGLTIEVRPLLEITIAPSPSTDGNYTVSWGAPRCFGVAGVPSADMLRIAGAGRSERQLDGCAGRAHDGDLACVQRQADGGITTSWSSASHGGGGRTGKRGGGTGADGHGQLESLDVEYGGTSTLSWSSTSVTGCTLDGQTGGRAVLWCWPTGRRARQVC